LVISVYELLDPATQLIDPLGAGAPFHFEYLNKHTCVIIKN
jgi:hypothetical protein